MGLQIAAWRIEVSWHFQSKAAKSVLRLSEVRPILSHLLRTWLRGSKAILNEILSIEDYIGVNVNLIFYTILPEMQ